MTTKIFTDRTEGLVPRQGLPHLGTRVSDATSRVVDVGLVAGKLAWLAIVVAVLGVDVRSVPLTILASMSARHEII